eukprot:9596802-Heterocapsa_arctica.AAC.1
MSSTSMSRFFEISSALIFWDMPKTSPVLRAGALAAVPSATAGASPGGPSSGPAGCSTAGAASGGPASGAAAAP